LADPIDGTSAAIRVSKRLQSYGAETTNEDLVDQYCSSIALFEGGRLRAAAIATSRQHVFAAQVDGKLLHSRYHLYLRAAPAFERLAPLELTPPVEGKQKLALGSLEKFRDNPRLLSDLIERFSCHRLGHICADVIECLVGGFVGFASAAEKLWDAAPVTALSRAAGLTVTTLDGQPLPDEPDPITSLRIAWPGIF
jgi:fructose-1,6-bisphosphatase/inositol monophosphatase family enzyme